jgi:hypothetical protein
MLAAMSAFDRCEGCLKEMPVGNLHCFECGDDLPIPRADSGAVLVQLYPASSQAEAFTFYRHEAQRLANGGWFPIAHSWGDLRPGADPAPTLANLSETGGGTLLVTYRHMGQA